MYSHDDFYFCPNWDVPIYDEIKNIGHKRFYLSSTQINTFGINYFNCGKNFLILMKKNYLIIYLKQICQIYKDQPGHHI